LIATKAVPKSHLIGKELQAPVLFEGIGHSLAKNNPYLAKILVGESTTFSEASDPSDKPQAIGQDTLLVSALQTRNNARVVFSGSLELCADRFLSMPIEVAGKKYDRSGNEDFCTELSKWNFGEKGILRAHSLTHNKIDSTEKKSCWLSYQRQH